MKLWQVAFQQTFTAIAVITTTPTTDGMTYSSICIVPQDVVEDDAVGFENPVKINIRT